MAGYAPRTPIVATESMRFTVTTTPSAQMPENVIIGSVETGKAIVKGIAQITEEADKIPQSAVQGLDELEAAIALIVAELAP